MTILFFRETELPELSPDVMARTGLAGTENSVICLAAELSKLGHAAKVCCPIPTGRWYDKVEYIPFQNYGEVSVITALVNPDG